MEVPGLPAVVKIGSVEITQQAGPIWTQHTYIRQRPGWRPHYDKTWVRLEPASLAGVDLSRARLRDPLELAELLDAHSQPYSPPLPLAAIVEEPET
jgi:hypothetical protein